MSRMSDLDVTVREAEAAGIRYFPVEIYADPTKSDAKVWAIFDVVAARTADHGIAYVQFAPPNESLGTATVHTEQDAYDVIEFSLGGERL